MAFVTESAATSRSFRSDLPTDPGVPLPLQPPATQSRHTNKTYAPHRLTESVFHVAADTYKTIGMQRSAFQGVGHSADRLDETLGVLNMRVGATLYLTDRHLTGDNRWR